LTITDQVPIGLRLAIRIEGRHVNAYVANSGDMAGAIYLGSILTAVCHKNAELFERFTALMADALSHAVKEIYGVTPTFEEEQPPEHERAGNWP
jgi:hypothetical protein